MKQHARFAGLVLSLGLLAALSGQAQNVMTGTQARYMSYLQNEPAWFDIIIKNTGGQPLLFHPELGENRIEIEVYDSRGLEVESNGQPVLSEVLRVEPNRMKEVAVDLAEMFPIHREGRYKVQVVVHLNGDELLAKSRMLSIVEGRKLGDYTLAGGEAKVVLKTLTRSRTQHLLAEVRGRNTGTSVYDLGRYMQAYRPQVMDDGSTSVTILHRRSPTQYCTSQFEFSGSPIGQKFLQVDGGDTSRLVRLVSMSNGQIGVEGAGVQRAPGPSRAAREEIEER